MTDIDQFISHQPEPLILLVDDDAGRLQQAARLIDGEGYRISAAWSGREAGERMALIKPDLVIVAESLAGQFVDAVAARRRPGEEAGEIPVLLVTGENRSESLEQAWAWGVSDYVLWPPVPAEWRMRIKNQVEYRRMRTLQHKLLEELQIASELINILSVTDSLTGFYNHRGFMPLAKQQLKLASRKGRPMMLAYMDVNGMKDINDRYGHLVGDQLLTDCSAIIRRTFRDSDIVARIGGDEFAVLLVDSSDMQAEQILARLEGHILQFNTENRREYTVSISAGFVPCPPDTGSTVEELLSQAGALMKKDRKNRSDSKSDQDGFRA